MTHKLAIPLCMLVLSAACADAPTSPGPATTAPAAALLTASPGARVVPGRYIVVFRDDVRDAPGLAHRLSAAHGGKLHHTYQHAIKGFAATLPAAAVQGLLRNPEVAYVQPDQAAQSLAVTQVVDTVALWALDRIDQRDRPYSGSYTYTENGQGVRVYVIDSGIQTTHPEFGGRAEYGYDVCYLGCNPMDGLGHGTRVAGVVGSNTYGVAKGAKLISVRVMSDAAPGRDTVGTTSTILAGVDWVTQDRARYPTVPAVANMSVAVAADAALDAAVRRSIAAGVTYVVGAGNSMVDACGTSPARVGEAITVGGSTRYDGVWGYSNVGPCVDLYAPAHRIRTTNVNSGTITSDGTSYSAPHVAGFVARYLQAYPASPPSSVHLAVINLSTKDRLVGVDPTSYNRLLYTVHGGQTGRPPGCCR